VQDGLKEDVYIVMKCANMSRLRICLKFIFA